MSIKDLAAEVATFMRQELRSGDGGRGRQVQDAERLSAVPERPGSNSAVETMSRAGSTRAGSARQLPRPPGTKRTDDTYSVDTLPEYVIGQSR